MSWNILSEENKLRFYSHAVHHSSHTYCWVTLCLLLKGIVHPKLNSLIIYSPLCRWMAGWVHKTLLEFHGWTALHPNPRPLLQCKEQKKNLKCLHTAPLVSSKPRLPNSTWNSHSHRVFSLSSDIVLLMQWLQLSQKNMVKRTPLRVKSEYTVYNYCIVKQGFVY